MQTKRDVGFRVILLLPALFTVFGCNQLNLSGSDVVLNGTSSTSVPAGSVSLKVVDQLSASTVFNDNTGTNSFSATAGKSYNISVNSSNLPAGSTIQVVATNSSIPNAVAQTIAITSGTNMFTPTTPGDYSLRIVVLASTGASYLTKLYAANVACSNPSFTANSLNANGLLVTGSDNLYTYNAAGVIGGANGQGPYQCAYDFTGVGIVDSAFSDCTTAVSNRYSPYVSMRNVGVIVKDACNTSYTVSKNVNLPAAVPSAPGNNFIVGTLSNATGTAIPDSRINGVHYSSINTGSYVPVQTGAWAGNFRIQSYVNYGQQSSVTFGMRLDISGLTGTFDIRNNINGTLSAASANVAQIYYTTDQAGDQDVSATLTSTTCTSSLSARVLNPTGVPCASGQTGSANNATIEVYGTYTCTNVNDTSGSVTISGSFDGSSLWQDSCTGGGGGGGGGVVPVQL